MVNVFCDRVYNGQSNKAAVFWINVTNKRTIGISKLFVKSNDVGVGYVDTIRLVVEIWNVFFNNIGNLGMFMILICHKDTYF